MQLNDSRTLALLVGLELSVEMTSDFIQKEIVIPVYVHHIICGGFTIMAIIAFILVVTDLKWIKILSLLGWNNIKKFYSKIR
ncbi:hypothetical protein QJU23_03675 [Pasteurella atlantica]|uniref:Uncharacterized protein n=2 Tax=Pasteurellaceae TaxID=712 RepID=A0ACC6HKX4_9PAST|nr:hypothetical protein [Pasteurella atlantica]MDP8051526.1 hypothetical protein [Pasteurella atlantica]MDP8104895.1 hypothetical protein [Pasteurella atlantica]MDP8148269.1 hypothetical protein [Pasteurella atlantica]